MDEAEVTASGFLVADCTSLGVFELVEAAVDDVAQGIDGGQLDQPVPLGRDDSDAAALLHIFANEVSVLAFVG